MTCSAEPLNRVFISIGNFPIYWYGVIIALGAFLGLYLVTREANRLGLKKDLFIDLLVFAIPISIICARIYYVVLEWDRYKDGPWISLIATWEGGIAIHGALIGAVLTAIVFARVKKVSFWQIADIAAPGLILGQAIGRWGNFMNQEAHGGPISEAAYESFHQYLPDFIMNQMCINGVMYHPTFLYESVWNILVLVMLFIIRRWNPMRGTVFLSYVALYSFGRFFIEGLRTDSLYLIGEIRMAQVISIAGIAIAVALYFYFKKSGVINRHYDGKKLK